MNIEKDNYADYVKLLSQRSGIEIRNIGQLAAAVASRLDFFTENGCCMADVGIEELPSGHFSEKEASPIFKKALCGKQITSDEKNIIYILYSAGFIMTVV